jgi:hypothetical protein
MDDNFDKILFIPHPVFKKELDDFIQNHCSGMSSSELIIQQHKNLLKAQLFNKETVIGPKHFGLATGFGAYEVYFLHMSIEDSGLKKKQMPKAFIYKQGNIVSMLCIGSHIDNYKNDKLIKVAQLRLREIIEVIKDQS